VTDLPWSSATDGLRLRIRLQAGARAEGVVGLVNEVDGAKALKIAVTTPAEKGRANDALLRLLARLFHLPQSGFSLVLGAGNRRKVVSIEGDPAVLLPRLAERLRPWLKPR
jgi:uncharacterized protein